MFYNISNTELAEVMEMDSPYIGAASIEGQNFNEMELGSTITLTCRVMEMEMEGTTTQKGVNSRHLEWLKNGEILKVKYFSSDYLEKDYFTYVVFLLISIVNKYSIICFPRYNFPLNHQNNDVLIFLLNDLRDNNISLEKKKHLEN